MRKPIEPTLATRRDFLNRAAALAAITVVAGLARAESGADARAQRFLTVMAAAIYPHPALPAALYANVASAMLSKAASDAAAHAQLNAGLKALDDAAGGDWLSLAPDAQLASLIRRQDSPFFQFVRGMTAATLYSNAEVWKRFGYGGDAWSFGGYSGKALNDIDWLPEPAGP